MLTLPREECWDLGELFADDGGFERAKRELRHEVLPTLQQVRGRLSQSAAILADALDAVAAATQRLRLLHCYASLKSDRDVRQAAYQAMRQEVELLATDLAERTAFLRPEILELAQGTVQRFLEAEPRLAPHRHLLCDLLRQRAHILGPAEERIIAESGLLGRGPTTLYQMLVNAELPRPEVELAGGERIRLTPVAFQKHRSTPHRPDRLKIFAEYFAAYDAFRNTLGSNLYASLKTHLFHARVRGYPSCLAAALDGDNVPESVYRNLIGQVRDRLPLLHRYFRLRARRLGLPRLEYHDLYGPLTSAPPRRFTPLQAQRLIVEGLAPLGEDYVSHLRSAFRSRWIDWHPVPGKRSGAYATGWAYEVHPYVLLNFNGDHEGVLTLAHEMGHALHSHFSNRAQPFPTADYPIFLAEVASTFNEALVLAQMLATRATDDEQQFLLASYLDGIRGTLFRQTMFAELELDIHERAERGEVLTGDKLSELYLALLRAYHGHDLGVVHVGEEYAVEWAAIPHLYYNFYVYQYATGIAAAAALACSVLGGESGAQERYLALLAAGGSDYPLTLLRRAGVDLESSQTYRDAFAAIERHLDLLERRLEAPEPR